MSFLVLAVSALTLGFLHGLGADHLMAIAAIAVDGKSDRRQARAIRTAVGFACGHALVLSAGASGRDPRSARARRDFERRRRGRHARGHGRLRTLVDRHELRPHSRRTRRPLERSMALARGPRHRTSRSRARQLGRPARAWSPVRGQQPSRGDALAAIHAGRPGHGPAGALHADRAVWRRHPDRHVTVRCVARALSLRAMLAGHAAAVRFGRHWMVG